MSNSAAAHRYFTPETSTPPQRLLGRGGQAEQAVDELVHAARAGDSRAWEALHGRFTPMLRGIARSYRLSPTDVDDVLQNTWLLLFNHVDRLREPAAVAGWLMTTARRECLRMLQLPTRELSTADPDPGDGCESMSPESELLASERRVVLDRALASLPERHRRLMTLFLAESEMDYEQLSAALAMPIGSIGPIRARSLARLKRHPELRAFLLNDG